MTDRERLTKHWGNNCVATKLNYDFLLSLPNIEVKNFNAIIQKLAHYEDLEEQGKIIVPPCKVGQTVWFIRNGKIIETEVEKIVLKGKGLYLKLGCNAMYETSCNSIGKTVFLTPEEAEKALAERQGENEKP